MVKSFSYHLSKLGKKGGKSKWSKMNPEERTAYAKMMAKARWSKRKKQPDVENAPSEAEVLHT